MLLMYQKKTDLKCPECGSTKLRVIPIANMAICIDCGHKWWIDKVGDEYVIVGDWKEVHDARKTEKEETEIKEIEVEPKEKEPKQEIEEVEAKPEEIQEETKEQPQEEQETEEQPQEVEEKPQEKEETEEQSQEEQPQEEEIETKPEERPIESEEKKEIEEYNLPPMSFLSTTDTRYAEFKELVERYVIHKYWTQVAKDILKEMVSELFDAGALGDRFNPTKVSRELLNLRDREDGIVHFYGINWLDRAVTKEVVTRIWLRMEELKTIMRLEKLKYYIGVFHSDDLDNFLQGNLSEYKVKKYLYEMEAMESGES